MTPEELRARILDVTLKNGGHLASSLGAVEIAVALAKVFDPQKDRILWDVGHQAYAWKLLTGRAERFDTLRQTNGIAPFPLPSESPTDPAVAGHAGSAFSVAVGLAAARDLRGSDEQIIAVVGDSSITNGHSFEALNNCSTATKKIILVINDNEMSISCPVGAFSRYLGRLLANTRYNRVKSAAEAAGHRAGLTFLRETYHKIESRIKGLFVDSRFFEKFGLRYIGPIDGHDLKALEAAFAVARADKRSVVVHVATTKGKGYEPAERDPVRHHGVSPSVRTTAGDSPAQEPAWSVAFGASLQRLARADERIVALTAGMRFGTGLEDYASEFPERFFDVGIAEGHLVSFAAGLAAGGRRPVVAVYSTFLQRAIDQVIHDVAIAKLPVVFCVDRAGLVGADGVTHQGLYDFAILKCVPNLTIVEPCSADDLDALLKEALQREGPTVIRYPRGRAPVASVSVADALAVSLERPEASVQIWTTGSEWTKAHALASSTNCGLVLARSLKPYDEALLARQRAEGKRLVSLENGCVKGGFGESIGADLRFGWPDAFVPHGALADLECAAQLDVASLVRRLNEWKTQRAVE